jgi:hypothetical protein
MKTGLFAVVLFLCVGSTPAQTIKWYKFDKTFIQSQYGKDGSAIGVLKVSAMHPAKSVHSISCGGNDGELHIGIAESELIPLAGHRPASAFAEDSDSGFGVVAGPPNVKRGSLFTKIEDADGEPAAFYGYFRVWNEGHDVGAVHPSNPHHVLEVHPIWGIKSKDLDYAPNPAVISSMSRYSGYGASKFRPLLASIPQWLRVAEDENFVYVQLAKAENFYQLPVRVKQVRGFGEGAGVAALVDVYSDTAHQNRVYQNLTVVSAADSPTAKQLKPGWSTYLLGFFSINLSKAMGIAVGHEGQSGAVPAPGALEFFAFGVPHQNAVSKSTPCTEEHD